MPGANGNHGDSAQQMNLLINKAKLDRINYPTQLSTFCTIKQTKMSDGQDKIVKTCMGKGNEPAYEEEFIFEEFSLTQAVFVKVWNENERYEDEKVNPIGSFVVTRKQLN